MQSRHRPVQRRLGKGVSYRTHRQETRCEEGGSSAKDKKKAKKAADGDEDSDTDPGLPELGDGNESELSELVSEQDD